MQPTNRKSWAGNLLMWSDLVLGPSFKVKRWFTGFGELSLHGDPQLGQFGRSLVYLSGSCKPRLVSLIMGKGLQSFCSQLKCSTTT